MTASSQTKNLTDPAFYRHEELDKERPQNRVDYRDQGGPLLSYLWCNNNNNNDSSEQSPLHGQDLYLGAEIGCDGKVRSQ
jgi:hypothetical protein